MFTGKPVGDRTTKKFTLRECASYASYCKRERNFIRKAGNGAASRINHDVAQ
jgi:hypothetical protein